jgi:hypothetical protein
MTNKHTEEVEMMDCPICCDELTKADQLFAIHCPTDSCNFNFCASCIRSQLKSAHSGYSEASDGSQQVKVKIQCPQCRSKYATEESSKASENVLHAVLCLRQAYSIQQLGDDSLLSASALTQKDHFFKSTSYDDVQQALGTLTCYHKAIGQEPPPVASLNLSQLEGKLAKTLKTRSSEEEESDRITFDPTLFLGLEELLTIDELEFLTQLLTSGKVESLLQASLILHGMTRSVTVNSHSKAELEHICRVRKRYPLPSLPRSVAVEKPDKLLQALDKQCIVQVVRHVGKLGLRRGDVVTHLQTESVGSRDELERLMESCDSLLCTVNANEATAQALQERAQRMKQDKINFYH